ncbi:MAG TPA: HD domain-containing protein [Phaeodactylibacter sp.]|nr:HD domain-containing protein [Phaeodactylibacter sp.]
MPALIMPELLEALQFAAIQHQYDRRAGYDRLPYINHLIKVTNCLANRIGIKDEALLLAAVLHDIVEDTEVTVEQLERRFGGEVAAIVEELTDDMSLPYGERKRLQVEQAGKLSPKARVIRLVDKASNLRDIFNYPLDWSVEKKAAYLDNAIAVAERIKGDHPKLDAWFDETAAWAKQQLQAQQSA